MKTQALWNVSALTHARAGITNQLEQSLGTDAKSACPSSLVRATAAGGGPSHVPLNATRGPPERIRNLRVLLQVAAQLFMLDASKYMDPFDILFYLSSYLSCWILLPNYNQWVYFSCFNISSITFLLNIYRWTFESLTNHFSQTTDPTSSVSLIENFLS